MGFAFTYLSENRDIIGFKLSKITEALILTVWFSKILVFTILTVSRVLNLTWSCIFVSGYTKSLHVVRAIVKSVLQTAVSLDREAMLAGQIHKLLKVCTVYSVLAASLCDENENKIILQIRATMVVTKHHIHLFSRQDEGNLIILRQ